LIPSTPENFLALETRYCRYRTARYVILPVPYDATTSYRTGTRDGPRAIINASQQIELFDPELGCEPYTAGIATLSPLEPDAAGPESMHERVFLAARRIVSDGKFPVGLGGEHSITSGLVRAVQTAHAKLSVLQIDAHADLRDAYQGSRHSHACVMRRVLELGARVVPVGLRSFSAEEARFMAQAGIQPILARQCASCGPGPGRTGWIEQVLSRLEGAVYVTIDMDGFDPAHAPGVGTPEPGGLDWYTVCDLLRAVAADRPVVGADVVEVIPLPGQVATEFLAARLIYKLIGYVEAARC